MESETSYDDTSTHHDDDGLLKKGSSLVTLAGTSFLPAPGFSIAIQHPSTNVDRFIEFFHFISESGLYFRDNYAQLALVVAKCRYVRGQVDGDLQLDTAILIAGSNSCRERGIELSEEILVAATQPDLDCSLVEGDLQEAFHKSQKVFGETKSALLTNDTILLILCAEKVKVQNANVCFRWC